MAWVWSDELARFAVSEMGRRDPGVTALTAQLVCYKVEDSSNLDSKVQELLGDDDEEPPLALAA
jgi:hypothetical protein